MQKEIVNLENLSGFNLKIRTFETVFMKAYLKNFYLCINVKY